jgi:hypothetical protein
VVNVEKLLLFLVQGIPESSGIIALSLALARVPLRWGRIIAAGTVVAVIMFFIRTSSFAAGLHTVAGLLLTVVIITTATRVPPTKALVVASISIIILGFLEMIIFRIYFVLKILDPQLTMSSDLLQRLLALPMDAIIIFIALLIPRFMTSKQDVWKI